MTARLNVTVYYCDHPDCQVLSVGRDRTWWLGRGTHYCSNHRPVCKRCGIPLRQQSQRHSDFPGTARAGTHGHCDTCSTALKRAEAVDAKPEIDIRYIKRLLNDHLDDPDDRLLVLETLGLGDD